MKDILLTKPIPRAALWGIDALKNEFGFKDFPLGIGQFWAFSCQEKEGCSNEILNSEYQGQTLKDLFEKHPEIFQSKYNRFPFIIGFVGPQDRLSVQVHPNNEVAKKHGYPSGKNEAWYFLKATVDADLIMGTKANNRKELQALMAAGRWDDICVSRPIHAKDFVYIPAGMLHALQKDVIVYEVQQATDVTYRFYDYNRLDASGKLRPLHLKEAMESIRFDFPDIQPKPLIQDLGGGTRTTFWSDSDFTIESFQIDGTITLDLNRYLCMSVSSGSLNVNQTNVKKGDSFLVSPLLEKLEITGKGEICCTSE